MHRIYQVILLCYMCLIVLVLIGLGDADENSSHRQRRYLSIRNNSLFFLRLNFKANMVPWTQIFAQSMGFRISWDEPPETFRPYNQLRVHRSTVFKNLAHIFDRYGLNGFHCIRRAICEVRMVAEPREIYHKILQIIFRKTSATHHWHNATLNECQLSIGLCPVSLLEASRYTPV